MASHVAVFQFRVIFESFISNGEALSAVGAHMAIQAGHPQRACRQSNPLASSHAISEGVGVENWQTVGQGSHKAEYPE